MKRVIDALTRRYDERDLLVRQRARLFVVVVFIIALLTILNFVSEVVLGTADLGSILGNIALILVYMVTVVIMASGRYQLATTIFLLFTIAGIALTVLTLPEVDAATSYRMAAGLLLPLVAAAVVALRYYQVILSGALAVGLHLYFHFARIVPAVEGAAASDALGSTLVYLAVATVLVVAAVWMTQRLMRAAAEETETSRRRLEEMQTLVATSEEGFRVGASVQQEIQAVRSSIEQVERTMRSLRDRMRDLATRHDGIRNANQTVAEATGTVKRVVMDQNSATEESSASIAEMAASIRSIDEVARSKKSLADGLAQTAQEGQTQMDESVEAIASLADKVSEISDVVGVIESISEQTSLLSMNAAIEAAHAGEHGRGFAVVAEEIRKLSENTSENTHRIADTISSIVEQIRHTRETNSEAGGYFQRITKEIFDVRDAIDEMISGLGELSTGTGEMDKAVRSLVDGSRTVDSTIDDVDGKIKDSNQDIEQLTTYSAQLLEEVDQVVSEVERIEQSANTLEQIGRRNVEQLKGFEEKLNSITGGRAGADDRPAVPTDTPEGESEETGIRLA